jgi:hypothetical protein
MIHEGGCHCGNLRFALETALPLAELPRRACQCSFCRSHGAISTSDPAGALRFTVQDSKQLIRYRFGLKLADFLVCARCGVYVAAQMIDSGKAWAVLNTNAFDDVDHFGSAIAPMDYDTEDVAARLARRKSRWTPVAAPA